MLTARDRAVVLVAKLVAAVDSIENPMLKVFLGKSGDAQAFLEEARSILAEVREQKAEAVRLGGS